MQVEDRESENPRPATDWPGAAVPTSRRLVRRLRNGRARIDLEVPLDRYLMNALLEIWYLGAYDFLRPPPGGVVIDAGASVGLFSVKASGWVGDTGQVIAVEPVPAYCQLLEENLARNSISNVAVVRKAIGEIDAVVSDVNGHRYETTTLDQIMDDFGLSDVSAVKLDIEGFEGSALRGAKRCLQKVDALVVETHSPALLREVQVALEKSGFHVFSPDAPTWLSRFMTNLARNPAAFFAAELSRLSGRWGLTGGPALLLPFRWAFERRNPDWLDPHSSLRLLVAQRRKLPRPVHPTPSERPSISSDPRNVSKDFVTVVVRTKNSAQTLERCLRSVRAQTYPKIQLIVVDNHSVDATVEIASHFADRILEVGPERCHQSNVGAAAGDGDIVYFIDSDFVVEPDFVEEGVKAIRHGADAVATLNRSDPSISFWAKVRNLERDCYRDDSEYVFARFVRRDVFLEIGGYDEQLVAAEDFEFHTRLLARGYRVCRIRPNEWHIGEPKSLREVATKHRYYGGTLKNYVSKYGARQIGKLLPFRKAYVRHWRDFVRHPVLAAGFVVYLAVKYGAALLGFLSFSGRGRSSGSSPTPRIDEHPVAAPAMNRVKMP